MARKIFTIIEGKDKEIQLAIRQPQLEDIEEADKVYAYKVASLVRDSVRKKLLLRSEIESFLREQKIWTKEDEKKVVTLEKDINDILNKLRKGGIKLNEVRDFCLQVMDKRRDIVKLRSKRQIFDDTTIESMADNERNDYLIYSCTVYNDSGKNYWASFEDMKNDKLSDAYRKASVAAIELIYGINTEFEKNLPENKLLRKYNFIDDELHYIDRKTGERVDRDGKPLKELEEESVKQFNNLQGDIEEESPFIDDETGEPITNKVPEKTQEESVVTT